MTTARRPRRALILAGIVLARMATVAAGDLAPDAGAIADRVAVPSPAFTVYYFHGTYRCDACLRTEAWTEETVRREFAGELASGRLDWHAIDAQDDANADYADRYQLTGPAVVIAAWQDGEVVRWRRLDDIWNLLEVKDEFQEYIRREITAFVHSEP